MGYSCQIIADSIPPYVGCDHRLTTMEITYPRIVHSEFMTHRQFSRNAASSRAIPTLTQIERILEDPFMPVYWGKNQTGMQARSEIDFETQDKCNELWLEHLDRAVSVARAMHEMQVHKQIVNRLLEPFSWITVIVSATEWENFFHLRCATDAQPEIRRIALMMRRAYDESVPVPRGWHLPYIQEDEHDLDIEQKLQLCVARCARVSYLNHNGQRDHEDDYRLFKRLVNSGHWSAFEHAARVAQPSLINRGSGNFVGWVQYRNSFPNECIHYRGGNMDKDDRTGVELTNDFGGNTKRVVETRVPPKEEKTEEQEETESK